MHTGIAQPGRLDSPLTASIVVPTCNRPDLLQKCLDAIAQALTNVVDVQIDVIVTDDSRNADSQALVTSRYPWVKWIEGPRRGPAANRNNGVRASAASWIVFTDDDCIPEEGWLQAFFERMHSLPECRVFEGRTFAERERRSLDEESPENLNGGYLWSCNMVIERRLFDHLGGFCETFPYAAMEDVDMRLRVQARGEHFEFVPAAGVCHPFRPGKSLRSWRRSGESYLHLVERHPQLLGKAIWLALPAFLVRRGMVMTKGAFRYRFRGLGHTLAVMGILAWFEVVARVRASRRAPAQLAGVKR